MPIYQFEGSRGGLLLKPHTARVYDLQVDRDSQGVLTGQSLAAGDLVKGQLSRTVNQAEAEAYGIMPDQGAVWLFDLADQSKIAVGCRLRIDGQDWQAVTAPQPQTGVAQLAHCRVILRLAEAAE